MNMKKKNPLIFFLTFILLFSSCSKAEKHQEDKPKPEVNTSIGSVSHDYQWSFSTPSEQRMEEKYLADMDKRIDENYPNINAVVIVRHGKIIYEKYYNGNTENTYNPVFSVTKSVISALVGIAIQEGYLKSLDQKISEFLPEYFTEDLEVQKKEMTIRHTLTMSGGLDSVDNNYSSWFRSMDWFEYVVSMPVNAKLGERFEYNTGLTHLLSGVLTKATSMSTKEFADKYLFKDLDISIYSWDTDPNGYYGGGHLLYLTPRDMARFGYVYLNKGKWGDKQIVPTEWVDESTSKKITADTVDYGYLWWMTTIEDRINNRKLFTYWASGYGGQQIMVVPELDLILVVAADTRMHSHDGADTSKLLEYVIHAAE